MKFIVYNKKTGKILRTVNCSLASISMQKKKGELIMKGTANDVTQKIVSGRVVDKTPEEIEVDNPTPSEIPFEKQSARITNEQWQAILNRVEKVENK